MGQDRKINPGAFVESVTLLIPVRTQSASGAVKVGWAEKQRFLAEILKQDEVRDEEDRQKLITATISFLSWNQSIHSNCNVLINEVQYRVDSVELLQRGMYAQYSCSYKSNTNDTGNDS